MKHFIVYLQMKVSLRLPVQSVVETINVFCDFYSGQGAKIFD